MFVKTKCVVFSQLDYDKWVHCQCDCVYERQRGGGPQWISALQFSNEIRLKPFETVGKKEEENGNQYVTVKVGIVAATNKSRYENCEKCKTAAFFGLLWNFGRGFQLTYIHTTCGPDHLQTWRLDLKCVLCVSGLHSELSTWDVCQCQVWTMGSLTVVNDA